MRRPLPSSVGVSEISMPSLPLTRTRELRSLDTSPGRYPEQGPRRAAKPMRIPPAFLSQSDGIDLQACSWPGKRRRRTEALLVESSRWQEVGQDEGSPELL